MRPIWNWSNALGCHSLRSTTICERRHRPRAWRWWKKSEYLRQPARLAEPLRFNWRRSLHYRGCNSLKNHNQKSWVPAPTRYLGSKPHSLAMFTARVSENARPTQVSVTLDSIPGTELLSSIRPVPTTDPIEGELAAIRGVKSISAIGIFGAPYIYTTQANGRSHKSVVRQQAAAIVGRDYLTDGRLVFVSGDRTSALGALDSGGSVIVPASLADAAGIRVGDTVDLPTGPSLTGLRAVGIVANST